MKLAKITVGITILAVVFLVAGSAMAVELKFKSMDDFHPERIANQVDPLRKLVETRQRLSDLLSKMDGNDRLEELLQDMITSTEKIEQLAKDAGVEKSAAGGDDTQKEE